jgi:hypothetical protein
VVLEDEKVAVDVPITVVILLVVEVEAIRTPVIIPEIMVEAMVETMAPATTNVGRIQSFPPFNFPFN